MQYEVKAKRNGKFWGFGRIQKNKWDNLQLSMKVTPELIELVTANQGGWLNFSLFEPREPQSEHNAAKANAYQPQDDLDDSIPF
jgi:hypothetical protein